MNDDTPLPLGGEGKTVEADEVYIGRNAEPRMNKRGGTAERAAFAPVMEFNFRYSNRVALGVDDVMRTIRAIQCAEGKQLTYRRTSSKRAA
jgi:hypothetical protein